MTDKQILVEAEKIVDKYKKCHDAQFIDGFVRNSTDLQDILTFSQDYFLKKESWTEKEIMNRALNLINEFHDDPQARHDEEPCINCWWSGAQDSLKTLVQYLEQAVK